MIPDAYPAFNLLRLIKLLILFTLWSMNDSEIVLLAIPSKMRKSFCFLLQCGVAERVCPSGSVCQSSCCHADALQ